jgi:Fe-coproporphyrin III synthase
LRASPFGKTAGSHDVGMLRSSPPNCASALKYLPLVTLYLTERCNSRCVSCDYWRHGRADMTVEKVRRLLPSLARLQTKVILISGGEPLLNPAWPDIAGLLRNSGQKLWLLTSGLSLAKNAQRAGQLFDAITVSLDGIDRDTYNAIRGLDAFEKVCAGIKAAADTGVAVAVRVTVQRANFRQLPALVELARQLGARQISFLAVDVANPHAFGRAENFGRGLALERDDLGALDQVLCDMERDYAAEFRSGFIAESPRRLRHMHQYFSAVCGLGRYPSVRCNAPELSAVIGATGQVSPCFFISGPEESVFGDDLEDALNCDSMIGLRHDIRAGVRPECARCVCSLWREPGSPIAEFLLPRKENA